MNVLLASRLDLMYTNAENCTGWKWVCQLRLSAMPMTSSSCHIYFHMPSGNQTKLWPVEKYWLWEFYNVHAFAVFDKFVQFLIAYYLSNLLLLTSFVFGHLTARNCPQWSQTELQFAKFQNILISASWFHTWIPALQLQTKNAMEIKCWFQKSNIVDLQQRSWKYKAQKGYRAARKKSEVRKN